MGGRELLLLFIALFLTALLEVPALSLRGIHDERLFWSIPLNLATNLLLNASLSLFDVRFAWDDEAYALGVVGGEALVVLLEAGIYALIKKDGRNLRSSLYANFISFFLGGALLMGIAGI